MRRLPFALLLAWLASPVYAAETDAGAPKTVQQIADEARASVVVITSRDADGREAGLGSGFLISEDGLIATNWHVVALRRRPLSVQLSDGSRRRVTHVLATERSL
ncbi:MAG: hypothetical protein ACREJB_09710, partial [Planctomycetaceae bacterium]